MDKLKIRLDIIENEDPDIKALKNIKCVHGQCPAIGMTPCMLLCLTLGKCVDLTKALGSNK